MSNQNTEKSYRTIIERLRSLRTQWRLLLLSHSLLLWLGILAFSLAGVLIIDQLLPLPRLLRMGIVVLWLGGGVYAAVRYLIRPVFRKLTVDRVAAYVETSYPGFENHLLSAVQLKPEIENNRFGYAIGFIEKLIEGARQSLGQIETKRVFEKELVKLKKNGGFAAGGVALFAIISLLFPSALKEFAQAFDELPKTPQEALIVQIDNIQPGNAQIESGADVTISAKVTGHLGAPVHLYYRVGQGPESRRAREPESQKANVQSSNGAIKQSSKIQDSIRNPQSAIRNPQSEPPVTPWRDLFMTRNETEIAYHTTIKNVTQAMEYYIAAKGTESAHYQIIVAREPIVSRFQLKFNYPKYTQLSQQVLEENFGDVNALMGTEVEFQGECNKPLASGMLRFEESPAVKLKVSGGNRLAGSFIVQRSERYHIELIDTDGVASSQPILYTINAIPDAVPKIEIVSPGRDVVLDESMVISLRIDAKDDYGVQAIRLVYRIEGQNEKDTTVPLKTWNPPQTAVYVEFPWNMDGLGIFPGDVVSYHAEAIDADNVKGPNIGSSNTYSIRFPSLAELYHEVESEQESEHQGLEALFNQQAEATATIDSLLDKIRKSQELTVKDEKAMKQVLENQQQIEKTAKDLIEDMKQTAQQMEKKQLFDLETVQKYQELQKLMDEALSEEHKEILRKLSEALKQVQLSEQEKKLMEANLNQEQFMQQLDRLKELYQQMILQQKLEAAAKQAKELAERQERLMEQAKNLIDKPSQSGEGKNTALAKQEERVTEGMNELHDKLDKLGDEMSKGANLQRVADEVKRLNQYARDQQIAQNLQSTSSQMRGNRMQSAMQPGRNAQQGLNELQQGLNNALEFMRGANSNEALTAMREAVRSGLYLSRIHEGTIDGTNEILESGQGQYIEGEVKRLQALAANELSTAAGIDKLASRLQEVGKQQMQVDPKIVWRLNAASDALHRSAQALEEQKPSLAAPIQKQGLSDINQAIADLLKSMDAMNQQMGMSGLENMLEQLQQLAQNQGQLNEMAQQLSEQMRQQGRTPSNEQFLKRLAYEQQMIREATGRLADMMEKLSQALGDLKNVAEEMKEVEGELQRGNLNRQVLDKQREILTRMLESSKSLQKRESSKQRKGEVAKEPTAPTNTAPPLDAKLLETIQRLESNLKSGQVENLPPQYRELIEQYFKALSQQTQKK